MRDRIIFFILGGVVGSGVTYLVTKKLNEKKFYEELNTRVHEEVKKMTDISKEPENHPVDEPESADVKEEPKKRDFVSKPDLNEYLKKTAENHEYTNYSDYDTGAHKGSEDKEDKFAGPYVIPSSEIPDGIIDDIIRYKYWADNVLTDEHGKELDDEAVASTCGWDCVNYFGSDENEPDYVYVRNDVTDKFYEISLDARYYSDQESGE